MNAVINDESIIEPERSTIITLGGTEYQLVLTTLATKSIARR